ncbi:MAG: carbamoyltransferase HypF, partial [Candidatus Eremiobacteraeota bacterium]|nr:carbamoyltransferase HypF [Candidatus Eremiobacteraeota bacterium]
MQGVGFRPFAFRLACEHGLAGWVRNGESGVEIHVEGSCEALASFTRSVASQAPPAARIDSFQAEQAQVQGLAAFAIVESQKQEHPTVGVSPDLAICSACLEELNDPADRRFGYPYINCTNCGPRYSIILSLPYDRPNTTMRDWALCAQCSREYHDPADRRFHAQPVACPRCGPSYRLLRGDALSAGDAAVDKAVELLNDGAIVAVKGLGGYHLACDARAPATVRALRERKYRKERPFALMVRDLCVARDLADVSPQAEALLTSVQRPIVLARAKIRLDEVAPDNDELGIMLPYTPLQYRLFAAGAPDVLVMTSANRSSEPIAYKDDDALRSLSGIADAFLLGGREIARRIDDSVTRIGPFGETVLRRARGYAPQAVARLPVSGPILALGADLKNAITLVVDGQAFVSQHIGDLEQHEALESFKRTIADLCAMYEVSMDELLVAHDAHPEYASTAYAATLPGRHVAVQHHRAHVASVLAERQDWHTPVVAASFDGTGYGDDGSIWGGEVFSGSVAAGFVRVASLRPALLPGGDAAARFPVQAAAGFLAQIGNLPDLCAAPFDFPGRYRQALQLVQKRVRTFETTSVGRLFDTVAALLGFTREISFEGQAAMWLEHLAQSGDAVPAYDFP